MATYNIALDTIKKDSKPIIVEGRVGDNESCVIVATITQNGEPYDFSGKAVRFECWLPDGEHIVRDPSVDIDGSTVTYTVPAEVLAAEGIIRCAYFRIYENTAYIESTGSFIVNVQKGLPGDVVSGNYIPEFDAMLAIMNQQLAATWELEKARQEAEKSRESAENARETAEDARKDAEAIRQANEAERIAAEAQRTADEATRIAAEAQRAANEAQRKLDEATRIEQEDERVVAEARRKSEWADMVAGSGGLHVSILGDGEYADGMPTIEGSPSTLYLMPSANMTQDEHNVYVEWMYINDAWEIIGSTATTLTPVSAEQIDAVFAGDSPMGEDALTLTGLSYFWAKLKAWATGAFAALKHSHSASDITEGTFGTEMLADGAITESKLAENAVGTAALAEGAVTLDKLSDDVKDSWDSQSRALYDGPETSADTIPLADDLSNYRKARIYYHGVGYGSTDVYEPDGKTAMLLSGAAQSGGFNLRSCLASLHGSTCSLSENASGACGTSTVNASNKTLICRIEGWR